MGQGTMRWKNGKRYEGTFKDELFHGWGKMVFPNGRIIEGNWKENEFVDADKYLD